MDHTGTINTLILKNQYKRHIFRLVFIISSVGCFSFSTLGQAPQRYEFKSVHMGTTFRLVFYAKSDSIARQASEQAFQKIENLNATLSDYKENSELNRLSRRSGNSEWISVSSSLFKIVMKAQGVSRETNGAFDITVGPFIQLWRQLRREYNPQLPSADTLAKLSKSIGYSYIKLNKNKQAVTLTQPHMQLDLGGIAKGFAADEALKVLQSYGIYSAFVDAGGDITIGDPPPGKAGWQIAILYHKKNGESSNMKLILANRAIATSGDLFQYIEIEGKQYSHIVDPKTGLGLTNQCMVTVIAPDGITADSYASAVSVLGPKKGMETLEHHPQLEGFIEFYDQGKIKQISSKKMKEFQRNP